MQASSETSAVGAPASTTQLLARRYGVLLAALLVLSALLLVRAHDFWLFTLDDAYITLRYSRHLAQGFGPSWNPGAAPAEGYTTLSWMLLLSLAEFLRFDGPSFAKGIGVLFALASFVSMGLLLRRASLALSLSPPAQMLGLVSLFSLFACYWPLSLHAVSGMETTLSCFVLSAFFLQSVTLHLQARTAHADTAATCRLLALAALACCLTRPEAVLPCGVTLLVHLIAERDHRAALVRACALWLALPFAGYYAWRWQHFGLLFPLSFYVKATGQARFAGLPDVLDFFRPFVLEQPWWSLLFVIGALRARPLYPSLLGGLSFVAFFVFPEHIMAFEGRYLLPLFPLLAATAALGLADSSQRLSLRVAARQRSIAFVVAACALALLAALELPRGREKRAQRWLEYGRGLNTAHVALGRDLADAKGSIALLDVGAIGYFADWHTIDTFGLNDAHVALSRRKDIGYVLTQRPDLLVVVSAEPRRYKEVFEWETPLYQAARAQNYQYLCEYEFEADYLLQVLARPGAKTVRGSVCKSATRLSAD